MVLPRNTIATLAVLSYLCIKKMRKRRTYVHQLNLTRNTKGEFIALVEPMRGIAEDHFSYFRMTSSRFDDLLRRLGNCIDHPSMHRMPISTRQQLAITLRFLAQGGSITSLAFSYHMVTSTLSNIIRETCTAIWSVLKEEFLKPPTRDQWKEIANDFWEKWNFLLCLGAIDGKHMAIRCPPFSGTSFFNYKGFFSVVLLAVVDANYKFVFVDIGGYGSEGDAGLFQRSSFRQRIGNTKESYENGGLSIPHNKSIPGYGVTAPHIFLGDAAFALQRHLITPYDRKKASGDEDAFNYQLCHTRRVVENAFGILVTRWRVLNMKMELDVEAAKDVVKACIVLHNYLKSTDAIDNMEPTYVPTHYIDYETEDGELVLGEWRRDIDHKYALTPFESDRPLRMSHMIRDKFKFFRIQRWEIGLARQDCKNRTLLIASYVYMYLPTTVRNIFRKLFYYTSFSLFLGDIIVRILENVSSNSRRQELDWQDKIVKTGHY